MTVREKVVQAVRAALGEGDVPVHVEVPKEPRFGDFSCNVALVRGGGRPLAEALRQRLPHDPAFREVRVEGPGFLNFLLSTDGVGQVLAQDVRSDLGRGERVEVPCLAEPPATLREARFAALQDAVARLLAMTGHEVLREAAPVPEGGHVRPEAPLEDAGRFVLLERPWSEPVELDLEEAADPTDRNPLVRVQRAHARAAGLLRMGRDQGHEPAVSESSAEREIVRALEALPWLVRKAARRREPHLVPAYARDLAERFHAHYEGRALLAGPPAEVAGRLALARGVRAALAACCEILGVDAPERT